MLDDLEAFVAESLRRYPDPPFSLKVRRGCAQAIEGLMATGLLNIQPAFRHMILLGLRDWTMEAAVLKFPDLFTEKAREIATARLWIADHDKELKAR